jgi:branched-chain amino acid transport system permease protein
VVLAFVPPTSPYSQLYLTDLALYSLLAVSFDVTFGYAGMLSLAQALFFGASSYTVAWLLMFGGYDLLFVVPAAVFVAVLVAILTGFIAVRGDNHGLLILTLIFVTFAYIWAQDNRAVTGGDDGLILAGEPFRLFGSDLSSAARYRFSMLAFAASFGLIVYLIWSPFGQVLRAIKDNALRAELVGFNTRLIKIAAFAVSGLAGGVAGVIYAIMYQHVHSGQLHWTVSASALIWAFFGGLGTLAGPVIGVIVIRSFEDFTGVWIGHPKFFTGLILIAMVLAARTGVLGLFLRLPELWRASRSAFDR